MTVDVFDVSMRLINVKAQIKSEPVRLRAALRVLIILFLAVQVRRRVE